MCKKSENWEQTKNVAMGLFQNSVTLDDGSVLLVGGAASEERREEIMRLLPRQF